MENRVFIAVQNVVNRGAIDYLDSMVMKGRRPTEGFSLKDMKLKDGKGRSYERRDTKGPKTVEDVMGENMDEVYRFSGQG
ncbi:hypothetical protein RUM44_010759 [Polyplax serrata]|uniref:Uncharacterized protein n=1 Tax=Polyplax serrata TaxID=468196 RepID=A0ABR1AN36_POLSC